MTQTTALLLHLFLLWSTDQFPHLCPVCPVSADVPFSRWSKEEVCDWLQEQGLGLYVAPCQSWLTSGQTLLQASQHELEKVSRALVRHQRVHLLQTGHLDFSV